MRYRAQNQQLAEECEILRIKNQSLKAEQNKLIDQSTILKQVIFRSSGVFYSFIYLIDFSQI